MRLLTFMLPALAAALTCPGVPAEAEPIFSLGEELPLHAFVVCDSLTAAKERAAYAASMATHALGKYDTDTADCRRLAVRVVPREIVPEIRPYQAWTVTYNSASPRTFRHENRWNIPYRSSVQVNRFYAGTVRQDNGVQYEAYVELPDRPYVVDYLKARRP
jgi:hypothetical protein